MKKRKFVRFSDMIFGSLLILVVLIPGVSKAEDWRMTFDVSADDPSADGGRLVNRLEAGGASDATDGYDNTVDVLALLSGPVQAAFSHENDTNYPEALQLLWRDIRSAKIPNSWRIRVVSRESGLPVKLAWSVPPPVSSDVCHGDSVTLRDETTGQTIDLTQDSSYTFTAAGSSEIPEVRYLTVSVGSVPQNTPSAPAGLVVQKRAGNAVLQWVPSQKTGLSGYHVWRSTKTGTGYVRLTSTPVRAIRYVDPSTKAGVTYYYVVTAMGANGCESGFSRQVKSIGK